ncbi:Rossmann-like and DUF2520 domain-containing protein [Salininema proteolyticum]|uniref:Rossmann-like and DUF2520 domain-containing protein n=1 Tax=Salininema proteolyticum TaxID=1607685 RepID=A0ABV8U2S7_9ACTN
MTTPFAPAGAGSSFGAAPRLDVGVVSAGRVGSVVGAALDRAGHRVTAVSGSSPESLRRAAELLPEAVIRTPEEVAADAQLLLLAVPDTALPELAERLPFRRGQIVLHTSGSHGAEVLRPAIDAGALAAAAHPAMTFLGTRADLDRLDGLPWAVTAFDEAALIAEALVSETGGHAEHVAEAQRTRYHAALAHASNHLATLVNDARGLLADAGISDAPHYLRQLTFAALDNALALGDDALTGPVVRGDAATVAAHLDAVGSDLRPVYAALAERTADRARAAGRLEERSARAVKDTLDGARTGEARR